MANFACCVWWLLAGVLLGWLLWQLFDRFFRRDGESEVARLKRDHDTALAKLRSELAAERNKEQSLANQLAETQARASAASSAALAATALAGAAAFGFAPQRHGRDDLTIVEGIGPKINDLLIADGITTFAQLAEAPVSRVQGILDRAGPHFRLAKPESWARQAKMCAEGDWAALRKYQDDLTAGVDKRQPDDGGNL